MGKKVTSTVGSKDIKVSRELLFLVRLTERKPLVGCVKTPRDVETNGKDVVSSRFSTFFFFVFFLPQPHNRRNEGGGRGVSTNLQIRSFRRTNGTFERYRIFFVCVSYVLLRFVF